MQPSDREILEGALGKLQEVLFNATDQLEKVPTDTHEYAEELVALKALKAELEDSLTAANKQISSSERNLIKCMKIDGLEKFTRHGHSFSYYTDRYVKSNGGNKDENLMTWLTQNGLAAIVKESEKSVNHQTLGATVREILDELGELPEGLRNLVTVTEADKISLRKA